MLVEAECQKRECKHYIGIIQPDGTEETERHTCEAFPDRIPIEIVLGEDLHAKPLTGQGNDIVFEKGPMPERTLPEGWAKISFEE
jgi:hypothetical protein